MENIFGASWKTAACGVVAAVGVAFLQSPDPTLHSIGLACTVFGLAGNGMAGKDSDVSHSLTGIATNVASTVAPLLGKLASVDPAAVVLPLVSPAADKSLIIETIKTNQL